MTSRVSRWVCGMALAAAAPLYGQDRLEVTGAGGVLSTSVAVGGVREATSGIGGGASGEASFGRLIVGALAYRGTLDAAEGTPAVGRDVGEARAWLAYATGLGLRLEGQAAVRVYASALGRQRWTLLEAGLRGAWPLGVAAIELRAYGGLVPAVGIDARTAPDYGLAAEAGVRWWAGGRVFAEVLYRLEEYTYQPGSAVGDERVQALGLRLGWIPRL